MIKNKSITAILLFLPMVIFSFAKGNLGMKIGAGIMLLSAVISAIIENQKNKKLFQKENS